MPSVRAINITGHGVPVAHRRRNGRPPAAPFPVPAGPAAGDAGVQPGEPPMPGMDCEQDKIGQLRG